MSRSPSHFIHFSVSPSSSFLSSNRSTRCSLSQVFPVERSCLLGGFPSICIINSFEGNPSVCDSWWETKPRLLLWIQKLKAFWTRHHWHHCDPWLTLRQPEGPTLGASDAKTHDQQGSSANSSSPSSCPWGSSCPACLGFCPFALPGFPRAVVMSSQEPFNKFLFCLSWSELFAIVCNQEP